MTIVGTAAHVTHEGITTINVTSEMLPIGTRTGFDNGESAISISSVLTIDGYITHAVLTADSAITRSEERRVGKECSEPCRCWWWRVSYS